MSGRNVTIILLSVLVLFVASNSLYVIKETERAVLLQFGEVVNPDIEPGLHLKIPFVNNVRKFDGRVLTVDSQPERFFTQEQKALIVDSYAKFKVAPACFLLSGSTMACVTRWPFVPSRRWSPVNVTS